MVLPGLSDPAVLELEDDHGVIFQVLTLSLRGVLLDADHAVAIICKQVLQSRPEGAPCLLPQSGEIGEAASRPW
jgi:hypothetical protein